MNLASVSLLLSLLSAAPSDEVRVARWRALADELLRVEGEGKHEAACTALDYLERQALPLAGDDLLLERFSAAYRAQQEHKALALARKIMANGSIDDPRLRERVEYLEGQYRDGTLTEVRCPPRRPTCGDFLVEGWDERCDDGNAEDGDGCSALCVPESVERTPPSPDARGRDHDDERDGETVESMGATSTAPIEQPTWSFKDKQFPTKEGAISAARAEHWSVISSLYYGGCLISGLGLALGGVALNEGRLFTQPSLSGVLGTIGIGACACGAGALYDYGVVQGEVRQTAAAHADSLPPERIARLTPAAGPANARDDRTPDETTEVLW